MDGEFVDKPRVSLDTIIEAKDFAQSLRYKIGYEDELMETFPNLSLRDRVAIQMFRHYKYFPQLTFADYTGSPLFSRRRNI